MLVITIIIMIILAATIILSLNSSGIIGKANEATSEMNIKQIKEMASVAYSEALLNGYTTNEELEKEVKAYLEKNGIDTENYTIRITLEGIIVKNKVTNPYDPDGWDIAYVCNDGVWNDTPIDKGNMVEGDIVAKLYKQDEILDMSNTGLTLSNSNAYHLVLEGEGNIPGLFGVVDGNYVGYAWAKPAAEWFVDFNTNGTTELDPGICPYISKLIVCDGITNIGYSLCSYFISLRDVIMADSVIEIENGSFQYCSNLKEIEIPFNVTYMGNNVFYACSSLTNISLPEGVTYIGYNAFQGCSSLEEIIIPNSVTLIDEGAFQGCSSLTKIMIPKGIAWMGVNTFENCSNLKEITLPKSLTQILELAFKGCTNLTDVYYEGNETEWQNISIGTGNTYLTSANIHYNSIID